MKQSTLSRGDFPVKDFLKPAKGGERMIAAFCGQRCFRSSELQSLGGSSLKTFLDCLVLRGEWSSSKCALTWKRKVTKYGRSLFQLLPKTHRTGETEYGLLPTANASDRHNANTKNGHDIKKGYLRDIEGHVQIAMLPTPSARDYKGSGNPETRIATGRNMATNNLTDAIEVSIVQNGNEAGLKSPLRLAPALVEWMMGYPRNYTDLNCPNQNIGKKD